MPHPETHTLPPTDPNQLAALQDALGVAGMPNSAPLPGAEAAVPPIAAEAAAAAPERTRLVSRVIGYVGAKAVDTAVAIKGAAVRAWEAAPAIASKVAEHGPAVAAFAVETGLHGRLTQRTESLTGLRGALARTSVDLIGVGAQIHRDREAAGAGRSTR